MRITTNRIALSLLIAAFALVAVFFAVDQDRPARAGNNILVTSNADNLTDDTDCTLREAFKVARENISLGDDCDNATGSAVSDIIMFEDPGGTVIYSLTAGAGVDAGDLNSGGAPAGDLFVEKPLNTFITITPLVSNVTRVLALEGNNVTLTGITIQNGNEADCAGITKSGGNLTLDRVTMLGNTTTGTPGSHSTLCSNGGNVTITSSSIFNNFGDPGLGVAGPVYFNGGTHSITNTLIAENTPGQLSGIDLSGNATMTVTNSTMTIDDTTGGGPLLYGQTGTTYNLVNVTLKGNLPNGVPVSGAVLSTVNAKNTIFSSNTGCQGAGVDNDQGGNIDDTGDCGLSAGNDSISDGDPNLGAITPIGGTSVFPLQAGSQAIDIGVNCPPPDTDQRGIASTRPKDGNDDNVAACDAGAYEADEDTTTASPTPEVTASPSPTPTGTPTPTPSPTPEPGSETPTPTSSATATATPTESPTGSETPVPTVLVDLRQGDFDCSGTVDDVDFLGLLAYVAGLGLIEDKPLGCPELDVQLALTGYQWGDVNCDGAVNALDGLYVIAAFVSYGGLPLPTNCKEIGYLYPIDDTP